MGNNTFRIEGVDDLMRQLERMAGPQMQAAVDAALVKAGSEFVESARSMTPVKGSSSGDGVYTSPHQVSSGGVQGALRDSIQADAPADGAVRIVAHSPVARMVEYGTSRTKAQPYFRRAMENEKAKKAISEAFSEEIKKVLQRF